MNNGGGTSQGMSRTTEGELRQDKQVEAIEILWGYLVEDGIGTVEVVIDVADLGVELQASNLHGVETGSYPRATSTGEQQPSTSTRSNPGIRFLDVYC